MVAIGKGEVQGKMKLRYVVFNAEDWQGEVEN